VPTQTDTGPRMAESVCICLYFYCVSEREREGGRLTLCQPIIETHLVVYMHVPALLLCERAGERERDGA
jgi:hypothetical protein